MRFYDRKAYEGRRRVRWPSGAADQPVNRRKVFRVDGAMATPEWVEIVAQWFRGSELALEALTELGASSDS